jgi:hypothetical protein
MPPHAIAVVIDEELSAARFQRAEKVDQRVHDGNLLIPDARKN